MFDPPVPLMRPQFAAFSTMAPTARHAPPARSGPLSALRSVEVLDQLRERIRYLHCSRRTEAAYVHWVRAFIRLHGLRHPAELGRSDIERFLCWLVSERAVAASTHRQALSSLLFFYRKVLGGGFPWMADIGRPRIHRRLPVVLTREEVVKTLTLMKGEHRRLAYLLYGTGLRIAEALQLRVKDLDFEHQAIIVRDGKGNKDRVVRLPRSIVAALREQVVAPGCFGPLIRPRAVPAWPCPMRWSASIRGPVRHGPGSGSSRKPGTRPIRARAWCAVTTCMTRPFCAPSSWR
jgi:integrase